MVPPENKGGFFRYMGVASFYFLYLSFLVILSLTLVMAAPESQGHINTSFLTTKLPAWAGVRQNITGSDLNGRPVPAFIPPSEIRAAEEVGMRAAAVSTLPVIEHATAIADAIEDMKTQQMRYGRRLAIVEARGLSTETGLGSLQVALTGQIESTLNTMAARINQLNKRFADIEQRLADLEEAVEEMEEEDETEVEVMEEDKDKGKGGKEKEKKNPEQNLLEK